jgi:hypothetical protein
MESGNEQVVYWARLDLELRLSRMSV